MKRFSTVFSQFLSKKDEDGTQCRLSRLWRHWAEAVDAHIAEVARPLGHKGTTLLLGVEDHMLMQELVHYGPAILDQANAYLGMNFFDKVHVDLLGDHVSLDALGGPPPPARLPEPRKPARLGGLLDRLDPHSPVGRCYRAYIALFDARSQDGDEPRTNDISRAEDNSHANDISQGGHTHE